MKTNDILTGLFLIALLVWINWPDADKKELIQLEITKTRLEIQLKEIELFKMRVDTVGITNKSNI